jgi:ubiquinone/menaquinone biosynthesis C-methylase UbiE
VDGGLVRARFLTHPGSGLLRRRARDAAGGGEPWHDRAMTDQEARYDRIAEGYAACWSPIHRVKTLGLLDVIEPEVRSGARRILDLGSGTGAFAAAAVARWPTVHVTGVDPSSGMLLVADRDLRALPRDQRKRIDLVQASADRLPFEAGSFDLVTTAFVLQLVPSRFRAVLEARRVLRPRGCIATLTWLQGGDHFEADAVYDEVLERHGFEARGHGGGGRDDPATPAAAAARLRRAGFEDAEARGDWLVHQFSPETFLQFLARFDDEDLFATMDDETRATVEQDLLDSLGTLPRRGLRLRLPVAYATARRPARP